MRVHLGTDGRDFDDEGASYQPGDVAWFEEDVLLVTKVEGDTAHAVPHPKAREMLKAALEYPGGARAGFEEAMRIHTSAKADGLL